MSGMDGDVVCAESPIPAAAPLSGSVPEWPAIAVASIFSR